MKEHKDILKLSKIPAKISKIQINYLTGEIIIIYEPRIIGRELIRNEEINTIVIKREIV